MNYSVKRSNRKTVSLEITPNLQILVRAPLHMPDRDISLFVDRHKNWIDKHLEKQADRKRPEPTAAEINALKLAALSIIPDRVNYYSRLMGLVPTAITITMARTRFGSCSGRNRISFSCFLLQYPTEAVDYVVVHELAHIKHKNHQKEFWNLVGRYMPDYKERRAMLRQTPKDYRPYSG